MERTRSIAQGLQVTQMDQKNYQHMYIHGKGIAIV
jgi:hypothetical protein